MKYILVGLTALMFGCATMVAPKTLEQRIAYVQVQVGAAYKTVGDLKKRDVISAVERDKLVSKIDEADGAVKTARKLMWDEAPEKATDYLNVATSVMLEVEKVLKAKEGK